MTRKTTASITKIIKSNIQGMVARGYDWDKSVKFFQKNLGDKFVPVTWADYFRKQQNKYGSFKGIKYLNRDKKPSLRLFKVARLPSPEKYQYRLKLTGFTEFGQKFTKYTSFSSSRLLTRNELRTMVEERYRQNRRRDYTPLEIDNVVIVEAFRNALVP